RGTLIHAWLQRIGWLEDGLPTDEELREIARDVAPALAPVAVHDLRLRFRSWLEQPQIRALLRRDAYPARATVEREISFLHRAQGRLVEGVIDRVVLLRESGRVIAAQVLDYKTDSLEDGGTAALTARVEHYRPQMEAYRDAVAAWYRLPLERVTARLLFLEVPALVEV